MASVAELLLSPGDFLYHEGDPNDCAYVVDSGEILLFNTVAEERVDIERRGPGSIVGELSILTDQPRSVSVQALSPCRIFRISAAQIVSRFDKLDPVLRACIETSIIFSARMSERSSASETRAPFAPSTLRDAGPLIERLQIENDLLKGLDRGELSMVYQPIVHLSDGSVAGFEALMRWNHPTLGSIAPSQFFEVAESVGLIDKLTDFALIQACAVLQRIHASPSGTDELYMSVNISGKDIGRRGFVDFLMHVMDLNNLASHHVKLEVTETALMPDSDTAAKNISRLMALGCGISIDDFGTGYSNLAYLKALPLTALKIDRVFAADAHANSVSRSIVSMLISLGNELDVDIVAEGLETIDDVNMLKSLGCRFAQGFYFYKPMPEADLANVMAGKTGVKYGAA